MAARGRYNGAEAGMVTELCRLELLACKEDISVAEEV